MRILIAQMTRMGDVLQTSTLVRALRLRYPDAHIAMLVRSMGRTIAERHPDINEVLVYDEDGMYRDLRSEDSDRLLNAYETAEKYVELIRERRFDVAYNCTHSITSAMLLTLAGVPRVIGAHLTEDWQFVLRGNWPNYFFTSVFDRHYNDLNLCDIVRHFLDDAPSLPDLVLGINDNDRRDAAGLLQELDIGTDDFVACFQLGASQNSKRWSVANFALLGQELVRTRQARILLVGVKDEAVYGDEFQRIAPNIAHSLFGKTNIPQLAALLERANVLVTNDTGTMHIAAAAKCPVVLVSVGFVHFRETGPYGEGHCAIERVRDVLNQSTLMSDNIVEPDQVTPEQVLRTVDLVLARRTGETPRQIMPSPFWDGVEVHMSRFAADGCLEWIPKIRRPLTERDILRLAYRLMWLDLLRDGSDPPQAHTADVSILDGYDPMPPDALQALHENLSRIFAELGELAQRGIQSTEQVLEILQAGKGFAQAKSLVGELLRLDEEIRVYGEIHPQCRPLVLIARFERDNLEGLDPLALAQTTLLIYRQLFERSTALNAKLKQIQSCLETPRISR